MINRIRTLTLVAAGLFAGMVSAENLTVDAAVGGAVGGALGGAVGAQLGGRDGAIAGAGLGAAAGVAINTSDHDATGRGGSHHEDRDYYGGDGRHSYRYDDHHEHPATFCPPGQAKKGRC